MLQGASTDLFNPLVPKAHNSECQNIIFLLQIKPVKGSLRIFIFYTLGTNGLTASTKAFSTLRLLQVRVRRDEHYQAQPEDWWYRGRNLQVKKN